MKHLSPTSPHNTSAEAHLLADAQTLNYEITLDGFPSANASERRGSMYANGAQQLAIRVKLWRAGGVVSPEEWDSLTLLHSDKKTEVDVLPIQEPPLLEVSGKWACTPIRSAVYEQAHDASPLMNAEEYSNAWTYRVLYLHSTVAETTGATDFYVCVTDADGNKHIMTDQSITISITRRPSPPEITITSKNIAGFDYILRKDEAGYTETYKYDYNLTTIEYFIVHVPGGFITCNVKGLRDSDLKGRCSIVRFERDHADERLCTVTGTVTHKDQKYISFDQHLYSSDLSPAFGSRLLELPIHGQLDDHTIIISVHRFDDVFAHLIPQPVRKSIFTDWGDGLTLTFRNRQGNEFEKTISFIPKEQNYHRNVISESAL
jgi:hypothetical protein